MMSMMGVMAVQLVAMLGLVGVFVYLVVDLLRNRSAR
jgi:flagellar biogenesis protein FliO